MADNRRNVVVFHTDAGRVAAEIVFGGLVQGQYTAELLRLNSEDFETVADDTVSSDMKEHIVSESVDTLENAVLSWTATLASSSVTDDFSITISYWQLDTDNDSWFELEGSPLTATGSVGNEPTLGLLTILRGA